MQNWMLSLSRALGNFGIATRRRKGSRRIYHGRRLRTESLEKRELLTTFTVRTTADKHDFVGPLSLREAIINAAPAGDTINFDPTAANVNGGSITLMEGEIVIDGKSLTIDATMLSNGITIDASGNDPTPRTGHDDTSFDGQGSRILNITDPSEEKRCQERMALG